MTPYGRRFALLRNDLPETPPTFHTGGVEPEGIPMNTSTTIRTRNFSITVEGDVAAQLEEMDLSARLREMGLTGYPLIDEQTVLTQRWRVFRQLGEWARGPRPATTQMQAELSSMGVGQTDASYCESCGDNLGATYAVCGCGNATRLS